MSELLAFQVFFALLFDFGELAEQHFITLFFVLNLGLFLLLGVLKVSDHLLLISQLLNLHHLVVHLVLGLAHQVFLLVLMLTLHNAFLLRGLLLQGLEARTVRGDLRALVIDLLLQHARNLAFLVVVLGDLLAGHICVGDELLETVAALLQADVVARDLVSLLLLLLLDIVVTHSRK
jgi:hypothetical protein